MNKSTEEQPRYVIDDNAHPKEDTKILPEEQNKIIEKLMRASGSMLKEEERDLIFRLQDKLRQETERVKSLKKVTIGDKPLDEYLNQSRHKSGNNKLSHRQDDDLPEGEVGEDAPPPPPRKTTIVGFKPEEVVQRYIECWNQQKFGAEYDCFSRDFMSTDRKVYIEARQKYYQSQMSQGGMRIDFGGIESCELYGGEADVTATKTITVGNRKAKTEKDLYRLKLEGGRWVISGVENLER